MKMGKEEDVDFQTLWRERERWRHEEMSWPDTKGLLCRLTMGKLGSHDQPLINAGLFKCVFHELKRL